MTSWWQVSPALAQRLGAGALAQLESLDPQAAHTCQVCGKVKKAGRAVPMAVLAAEADDGTTVVGLAHLVCHDRVGDSWPGLLGRVADKDGVDAQAVFAIRQQSPHAVLAFEPAAFQANLLGGAETVNAYVSWHLQTGFSLMTQPLLEVSAALAGQWQVAAEGDAFVLRHRDGAVDYTQPLTVETAAWLQVAQQEGECVVVTGTHLNIDPSGPVPTDFAYARRAGTAVVATVAVH